MQYEFDPHTERLLRAAGIAVNEFQHGYRATDSCIVATRLAFHLGLRVIPIKKKSKRPCLKGWPNAASSSLGQILRWRESMNSDYGIATGAANGIHALDFDGPKGNSDFSRLSESLGPLPATVKVISGRPSGGFHLWFKASRDAEDLRTVAKVLESAIDVRGYGGQIVIPGSVHKSGALYQFAPGCAPNETELAFLPQAWFDALPKRQIFAIKSATRSPSSGTKPPRARTTGEKGSVIFGDAPGGGGFNGPIYKAAVQLIRTVGVDAIAATLAAVLRAKVLNAPVSADRDPSDIERYASDSYLLEQIERARAWVVRENGI